MSNNIDSLSVMLKEKIKNLDLKLEPTEEGKVISISDGIASVSGIKNAMYGEIISFPDNLYGVALDLNEDFVGVILLGDYLHVNEGDKVVRTKELLSINYGDELLGRIINPIGEVIDGGSKLELSNRTLLERVAKGIMSRKSVNEPLETGILAIDSIIPIGKGQRELIIGDRKTGKTAIALDTIINQRGKNVKCIYVSIGQKNSTLSVTVEKLRQKKALDYTTIISANASDSDALKYFAPYAGIAIAEEWMIKGDDVLIVFDDLTKHAIAYRTISLLLRRPPGREAYPGDVFYLHSRLLERAAKLNEKAGGGSITALPIIETQAGDISAYIPTNVISITDGQIFLIADAFKSGQRPAVDAGLSVSRVGSSAQTKFMKKMSSSLKLELASYSELKAFSEFSSDLDDSTKAILNKGEKIMEFLKQAQYYPLEQTYQGILLFIIKENILKDIPVEKIINFKSVLEKQYLQNPQFVSLVKEINQNKDITEEQEEQLKTVLIDFVKKYNKGLVD